MSRRSDQLDRIEAYARRVEEAAANIAHILRDHGEDITAAKADAQAARASADLAHASADAAHAGVQYLADMLPIPGPTATVPSAPPSGGTSEAAGDGRAGEAAAAARRAPRPKGGM
jgi:hypothetical protein